jgi:purine-binding chemotaxis protein CheW
MDMIREGALIAQHEAARSFLANASGEYLTFRMGTETYGVDIVKVQEIRDYTLPARTDNTNDFLRGTINLRGTPVPVIDLRLRLGCKVAKYNRSTAIVVVNAREGMLGLVVDSVAKVTELSAELIKPVPVAPQALGAALVVATATLRGSTYRLMDMDAVVESLA